MKKHRKKRDRNEIRVNSNRKRIISLTMMLVLCLMLLPTPAFAAEDSGTAIGTGGLCAMTEITAWSWVDAQEVLDPDSGVLALSASADRPALYEDIVGLLPADIEATTENGIEPLSLENWSCDDYPAERYCQRAMGWQRMHLPSP